MKEIHVVAAIIKDSDNKVLVARRKMDKSLGGYWEFPGGKIDVNESKEQAIEREIREEMNIGIHAESYLATSSHEYDFGIVHLHGMICHLCEGEEKPTESTDHDAIDWLDRGELFEIDLAPADIPLVEAMQNTNKV